MPNHWILPNRPPPPIDLPLAQVGSLLSRLGVSGRQAVAEELLQMLRPHVPLAQCTLFSHAGHGQPRIVDLGDRARTVELPRIAQDYAHRFYPLDGSVKLMRDALAAARRKGTPHAGIVLHRQRGDDIAHREYRAICYDLPQVAERIAVLVPFETEGWLSVNFYRGIEHGPFDDAAVAVIEAFAPLVAHALRLHYTRRQLDDGLSQLLLQRLSQRHPALTKRDLDVVRGVLEGLSTEGLADRLGLTPGSVQTYLKRIYRKTGVSGQRELIGRAIEPGVSAA